MRVLLIASFLFMYLLLSSQSETMNPGRPWMTTGNNNTLPASNFLGTIDAKDLVVRTTNVERLRVLAAGNVGIGVVVPTERLHVFGNLRLDNAFMPGNNAGTAGQVLRSQGPGLAPIWSTLSGSSTFSSYTLISNDTLPDNFTGSCTDSTQFYYGTQTFLPDLSNTNIVIPVSLAATSLCGVILEINIDHTWDADLDISLISPLGTVIDVCSDNGGSADNFTKTVFDDNAAISIVAGTAPFTGTYRPEQPFSTLSGQDPNGNWTLNIVDDLGADVGTFYEAMLTILTPVAGAFTYLGETAVPVTSGEVVTINSDFSIKANSSSGIVVRLTRDVAAGSGSVGTVIGYCADSGPSGSYSSCGISDSDPGLATGTYYYKLWQYAPGGTTSTRNYSLIVSKQ